MQSFDATQDQTIDWGSVPSGVSLVQALILNGASQQVWIESLDPSTTSVQLPADTLAQDTAYRLVLRWWAPSTTNLKPPTALGYISSVVMDVQTSANAADPGVSLAHVVKQREFLQEGNDQATTPVGWEFAAGVEGGLNVTGGSLAYPGGVESLQGSDGEYDIGEKVYGDQASLNIAYPNADYTLNITIDGQNQSLGPLNLTGDGYPAAPHITDAVEFQASDHSQNFTVTWDAFSGADPDDRLIIELWNRTTGDDLIFEFLDVSATSYEITGGFLTEGNQYELTILFVNTTDSLETPETVVGYISRTALEISTITSDTTLLFYKSFQNEQTGESTFAEVGYQPLSIVSGLSNTVTDAALITPFGYIPLNPAGNFFIFVWPLDTKAALDGEFPVGEYRFDLTENGAPVSYGPYDLPGDAYPEVPLFQNFGELEVFDATQDKLISWGAAPEDVTGITVQARTENNAVAWTINLDPSETSTTLPANTLLEVGNYNLLIHFWARKDGSEFPNANIGYRSSTFIPIQTFPELGSFEAFLAFFFTEGEILDPIISGQDADPDGDGLSNYFEFLGQLDPTQLDSRVSYEFGFDPSQTLIFSPLFESVNWAIETSIDLLNWTTVSEENYSVVENDVQIDLEAFPPSSFFRLVLQPTP